MKQLRYNYNSYYNNEVRSLLETNSHNTFFYKEPNTENLRKK
jgi:hypothetical protein